MKLYFNPAKYQDLEVSEIKIIAIRRIKELSLTGQITCCIWNEIYIYDTEIKEWLQTQLSLQNQSSFTFI